MILEHFRCQKMGVWKHDYIILIRFHTWNYIRCDRTCMCGDYVRQTPHRRLERREVQMSSASVRFGTKAYVCARYFLRPGKCFKYIDQRGEDVTEHVYEVVALYPYCVLLRDTRNGVRTCPGYNTLSLMLRGSEASE